MKLLRDEVLKRKLFEENSNNFQLEISELEFNLKKLFREVHYYPHDFLVAQEFYMLLTDLFSKTEYEYYISTSVYSDPIFLMNLRTDKADIFEKIMFSQNKLGYPELTNSVGFFITNNAIYMTSKNKKWIAIANRYEDNLILAHL